METTKPLRKACDLCYHKKLKCDSLKPRCSTCVVYDVECTHKAASRKKGAGAVGRRAEGSSVQKTVKGLEEQLAEARREVERLQEQRGPKGEDVDVDGVSVVERRTGGMQRKGVLPPYEEAVALIEEYLSTFNTVFPLFDAREVLQTTRTIYTSPGNPDPLSWALLNTVLALATHTTSRLNTSAHLAAAQSVLSQIISDEEDLSLLNVQIPLGLCLLFHLVSDLQPAMILIATALRLAHRLGLQSRAASVGLDEREVGMRRNVFWIVYILDRDTSMLAKIPPIQQDADIDIELPSLDTPDTFSSSTGMSFFRSRVLLARIQGKVYGSVYSLSAQHSPTSTRAHNIALVLRALDDWSAQIPQTFHAPNLLSDATTSQYFVILYGTALGCRALISHASSRDSFHYSEWVGGLRAYGRAVSGSEGVVQSPPVVEKGWGALVRESREYLGLFEQVARGVGWLESLASCAYFTGLVCLVANAIFDAQTAYLESDQRLMDSASLLLDTMSARKDANRKMRELRDAVQDLRSYADAICSSRCRSDAARSWDNDLASWFNSDDFAALSSTASSWSYLS